jgi:hypothetical protein
VCICEANYAAQSLTHLVQASLAAVARALPPVRLPAASDAVKTARASAGLNPKAPAGSDVSLQPLLFMTEVPKKPGVLEVALDFGRAAVCITRGLKDSVFAGMQVACGVCVRMPMLLYMHADVCQARSPVLLFVPRWTLCVAGQCWLHCPLRQLALPPP